MGVGSMAVGSRRSGSSWGRRRMTHSPKSQSSLWHLEILHDSRPAPVEIDKRMYITQPVRLSVGDPYPPLISQCHPSLPTTTSPANNSIVLPIAKERKIIWINETLLVLPTWCHFSGNGKKIKNRKIKSVWQYLARRWLCLKKCCQSRADFFYSVDSS